MSRQIQVNTKEQLFALMGKGPKTTTGKTCPRCQQKMYRVFIKGQEKWMGCACSSGRAHHYY